MRPELPPLGAVARSGVIHAADPVEPRTGQAGPLSEAVLWLLRSASPATVPLGTLANTLGAPRRDVVDALHDLARRRLVAKWGTGWRATAPRSAVDNAVDKPENLTDRANRGPGDRTDGPGSSDGVPPLHRPETDEGLASAESGHAGRE